MQCPNDKTEMEEGWLSEPGDLNVGFVYKNKKVLGILGKLVALTAWVCPQCGKVELYTKSNG